MKGSEQNGWLTTKLSEFIKYNMVILKNAIFSELIKVDLGNFGNKLFILYTWYKNLNHASSHWSDQGGS